jgi:hypothetical protein
MIILFWFPVAGLFFPSTMAKIISACALCAMALSYFPTLRFYGLTKAWAL